MSLQVWLPLNKDPNMTPAIASFNKESGVTLTEDTDGWYKVQDTTHGANNRWGIYYNFNVKPNTTYTLYVYSKSTTGVSARVGIQSFATTYAWPGIVDTNTGAEKLTTYTWTTGANHNVARIYLALTTTATKANDYVFYKAPMVYEAPQNQGVGNVSVTNLGALYNTSGKLGGCYYFDGVNQRIACSELALSAPFTLCGWFKPTDVTNSNTQYWLSYNTSNGGTAGHVIAIGTYQGKLAIWRNASVYNSFTQTLSNNQWYHIAVVMNNGNYYVYLNGALILSSTYGGTAPASSWFTIGARSNSATGGVGGALYFYKGYMNDVRLYDIALSVKEVKELARGLVLHYPLDNNGLGNENLMPNSIDTLVGSSNYNTGTWRLAGSSQMTRSRVAVPDSPIGTCVYGFQSVGKQTGVDASCWGIDSFPRESGVTYTVSAWGRIVGGSATAAMLGFSLYSATSVSYGGEYGEAKSSDTEYYGSGAYDYAGGRLRPDGKWTRIWRTFTSTASSGNIYIGFNTATTGDDVTLQLCGVKLEKGNKITQWCPNVSDTLYTKMSMNNNIVYDISGFNHNGTITGSLSTLSDSVRYKVSTYFSGSSYISREPLHSGVKSFSFWLKCANASTTQQIVFVDFGTKLAFGFYNGYIITSYTASAIIGNKVLIGNSWINDDWNHIVVVKDNNAISTYCNGTLMTASGNDYWSYNTDEYFMIGRRPHGDRQLLGYLSDFRAYATALSASDIAELYSMGREVT